MTAVVHSSAPRLLRVQVEEISYARDTSCVSALPTELIVVTKLRGHGSPTDVFRSAPAPAAQAAWAHEIYEFHVTEAEMYTRVLECVVLRVNCLGMRAIVGSAKLPLSTFERERHHAHATAVALDNTESDLRVRVSVDVWDATEAAAAIEGDAWEHERYERGRGWSSRHLRADDRPVYRCGPNTGNDLAAVVPPTPTGYIESLGWAADTNGWFYATSFAGPWHNSKGAYACRRRRIVHRYRKVDAAIEPPVGQSVAMPDMSLQASLHKHKIATEDY
ncbi:hypothetical protein ACHHYP_13124 [Achlya hypogyna]|uniref:Peroxin/Ferlin domain-containing protein n=1 Tax=Achlya hypogyna TaxID=1202772 RepID=A0A1V9YFW4_ACHHY|nr:hypothetical protein ACHHYP_13124 [Achlya hypogyna]